MCIFCFYKPSFGRLSAVLAFAFLVSGCHTGNKPELIQKVTAKKDETGKIAENKTVNSNNTNNKYANNSKAAMRDPFTLPAVLQKQKNNTEQQFPSEKQKNNTVQMRQAPAPPQTLPMQPVPRSQEPCIAGIFDNGNEKFALLRWHQVQGVFRKDEPLGNGYCIKEITATSVLLFPEHNHSGTAAITLQLQ